MGTRHVRQPLVRSACVSAALLAGLLSGRSGIASGQTPAPSMVALFNTAGNLGYATVRAAYSPPDAPMPNALQQWTVTDYSNIRQWSALNASCIAFDLTRFDAAAAQASDNRLTAQQMFQLASDLQNDYRAALQRTRCSFGYVSPQERDAFWVIAFSIGMATARASFHYYPNASTPPPVGAQIAADLAVVRGGLPLIQQCAGPTAAIEGQIQSALSRLGAVSGQDSYADMAGIYAALESGLKVTSCTVTPVATPTAGPCDRNHLPPACAEACRDSVVLLGTASASAECQACIDRACK